jgi:hypothetical protein
VCRTVSEAARLFFSQADTLPTDDEIWSWIDLARDRLKEAAKLRSSELRQFASTLVGVLATQNDTLILHVGDGAAVLRVNEDWVAPSWPENGEYASTTFFVTDEPAPKLRITRLGAASDSIAVFSDGLERLALDFREKRAHIPFFEGLFPPIWAGRSINGPNRPLAVALKAFLDSPRVVARTDDDKSLILAARQ